MAKVKVPDQYGGITEIELDSQESVSLNSCGKHAPAGSGMCVYHECYFQELHDLQIQGMYGVDAIFYCPKLGCDNFDWDVQTSHLIASCTDFFYRTADPYSNMRTVVFELFQNAARLKVLFLKQRQLVEKLERSGIFEGGKKI